MLKRKNSTSEIISPLFALSVKDFIEENDENEQAARDLGITLDSLPETNKTSRSFLKKLTINWKAA